MALWKILRYRGRGRRRCYPDFLRGSRCSGVRSGRTPGMFGALVSHRTVAVRNLGSGMPFTRGYPQTKGAGNEPFHEFHKR